MHATASGPKYGCAVNRPYQPWNAEAASSMCIHTPVPTSSSSCITRSTSAGPITPTIPLRVATENRTARLVNANIGRMFRSQATVTSHRLCPVEAVCPPRSTSAPSPISSDPAARLETASSASRPTENVIAASTLPANRSRRVEDRVSTIFHVP